MYKRITSLSIILALAACSADSQPGAVAVNAGDAAVTIDVGHLTASKGRSGQFGQPATVSLPHVEAAHVEIARVEIGMASSAGEARVQQPGSLAPNLSEIHDESSLVPQAVNAAAANDANTDASVAGAAAARPLDLSLDYQPGVDSGSPGDWFAYVPGDTSAKGFKGFKGFDARALFNRRADNQDQELSFSFVPTLRPGQELAWTRFPELDGGSVNFEVKTR
jgi:hypothetical protein